VITSRTNSHTLALFLVSGFGSLILSACTEGTQPPTAANAVKPSFSVSTPVDDKVMGDLSVVAQDIIGALRNPGVRGALVRALKTSPYYGQIDLQDCGPMSLVGSMLQAAEGVGLGSANAMCALLSARRGVILYMDRDRLGGWDSTTVPVVTALIHCTTPSSRNRIDRPIRMCGGGGGSGLAFLDRLSGRPFTS